MVRLVYVYNLFVRLSAFVSYFEILSSEFVLSYRLASPLLMALIVVGGWYEVA